MSLFYFSSTVIKCAILSSLVAVVINLIASYIIIRYATKNEIKPVDGPDKLSFKSQLMHALIYYTKIPLSSSLIVFIISVLAVLISHSIWKC